MQWFPAQSVLEIFLSLGRVSSSRQDAVQQLKKQSRGVLMLRVDKMSITEFPKTFSYGLVTNIESDHKPSVSKVVTSEEGWGLSQDTEAK